MNSEKVISNIKKEIKKHLDNNYAYDMLVDFELDVIDWNSLFEYIDKLQQENKKYKEVIDKAIKLVYIVQQNKDNDHLEPIICIDELDELLDILKEADKEVE